MYTFRHERDIFWFRFLQDLEEEAMNNDSVIWQEEIDPKKETLVDVTPVSPQSANDTRYVVLLDVEAYIITKL